MIKNTLLLIPMLVLSMTVMPMSLPDTLEVGIFSRYDPGETTLPENWEPMNFRGIKPTSYELTDKNGKTVIKADSDKSSSGLIHRIDVDLEEYPVIRWSWLAENIIEQGDVTQKSGDDYPVRIYVIFDYDLSNLSWWHRNTIRVLRRFYGEIPGRAINYIWDNSTEIGTVVENPYTDLVMMQVVESGKDNLDQWMTYERNIYEDYKAIYDEEPPKIGGIAIMTDTDDTKEAVTAYFGDIKFLRSTE
ncbi:MAG: DUF3047 domain-containing protein [Balneolales bacterium]